MSYNEEFDHIIHDGASFDRFEESKYDPRRVRRQVWTIGGYQHFEATKEQDGVLNISARRPRRGLGSD